MRALTALSRFVSASFPFWVLLFAILAFFRPAWFLPLTVAIAPLLGLVMFGMGLTLKGEDFREVARHPIRVLIGVLAQFVIMPGLAWLLCRLLGERTRQVAEVLPLVSVFSIVVIIAAVVAASQARIAESGLLIMAVVMLHNGFGLSLGYLTGKLTGMPLAQRKALAIEVGMQNSGLGAALANAHFSPLAAVPSALFSVWHNLSGSLLAALFRRMEDTPR